MPLDVIEQARRYIAKIDPAISGNGGHDQTYSVAMVLVEGFALSSSDAKALLTEYSARCSPPWAEYEIDHKIADAERLADPSRRGKLIRNGVRWKMPSTSPPAVNRLTAVKPAPTARAGVRYEVSDALELPDPVPDGARAFLRSVFNEGEGIRIAVARTNDEAKEVPKDAGVTLTREEWLRKLDEHKGNPNGFLKTSDHNGIFISVNPMQLGGSKDSDVTAYRHALLEFDNISQVEQWGIIQASQVPCAAVISSGRKSIHAWVRVDAQDAREFSERVKLLYAHFSEYKPDEKNKNPSRFSRLPFCERGQSRQELLALRMGADSFTDWLTKIKCDALGTPITPAELEQFKPESDDNCLLGNRYLGIGMAALIVAGSGLGKSSGGMQMAASWAIALPAFGVKCVRALKSLFIQAENDLGDLAEMYQGIIGGMGIKCGSDEHGMLYRNLVFQRDTSHTGPEMLDVIRRLLDKHRPDLLWLDPLNAFVGADISRQDVVGQFFRVGLNPIIEAAKVACFCIHHTGKPPSDKGARQNWQVSDYAYAGLGSSDLTNWARAVILLQDRGQGLFELKFAKRGKRAGIIGPDGPTTSVWIRQSSERIFWEMATAPEPPKDSSSNRGRKSIVDEIASKNLHGFCSKCKSEGETLTEIAIRLMNCLAKEQFDASQKTCQRAIPKLVENGKLTKLEGGLYTKGPNA